MVTAPGSGAEIIPFLKTWVNLPMAIAFTVLYSSVSSSNWPDSGRGTAMNSTHPVPTSHHRARTHPEPVGGDHRAPHHHSHLAPCCVNPSQLSNTLTSEALFYTCIIPFIMFFGAFAALMYPLRDTLHPTGA